MKKAFILAILTVLMIIPTVACGKDEDTSSAVNSSQSTTEENPTEATQVPTEEPTEALTEATYAPTELPTEATELPTEELTETASEGASTVPTEEVTPITVTSYTNSISPGGNAFLEMQGLPNIEYDIAVYYSSGASEAEGLENKVSDANGYVRWDWQVGPKTKAGTFKIVISGNGQKTETQFTVTE